MSLVNYDSTRTENCGVIYDTHNKENIINTCSTKVNGIEKRNNKKHGTVYKENHFNIESSDEGVTKSSIDILIINNIVQKEGTKFSETTTEESIELLKPQTAKKEENPIDKNSNDAIYGNVDNRQASSTKYALKLEEYKKEYSKRAKNDNNEEYRNGISENIKKTRHKYDQRFNNLKTCANNALKRTVHFNVKRKWSWNSGFLISLVLLNVAGQSCAEDTSNFTPGLTTRMLASFLGYPSTCAWGGGVRPCSLTLSCWLRGGTALSGCGGWLFSCCHTKEPSTDDLSNSIPSSDWQYKPPSPKLRVPQRTMPNNVFRRRVDDDVTQLDCGLPSSRILQKRIIGGREARFAEFPWQAHVRISEFQCGGVLVSRRYVATAAHCVSRAHTRDIAVWLGAIDTSATHHPARKLGVIQKILHPLFQFRMTQPDRYDIALLKLSRPITYMSHILPICLPDYDMDLRGRSGVIAGWGKTDASNGHTGTNLLRSATVPILSKEQCINWHQSKQISVEIHSEMICAGHSDGHQDACLGDSGGPLIVLDNGRYYLVGITSAGFGCGVDHQPGIYHNVKLTANWIRSVIAPSVNYNDNYLK